MRRILTTDLSLRDQILFLLLCESPQTESALQVTIEYKNHAYFRKVLAELHKHRLIEYAADGMCTLSPKGYIAAESIALQAVA